MEPIRSFFLLFYGLLKIHKSKLHSWIVNVRYLQFSVNSTPEDKPAIADYDEIQELLEPPEHLQFAGAITHLSKWDEGIQNSSVISES